ncbi:MAG: hypothetical protein GTO16_09750 [Candidatus Aminicenantes bacterium]|nr:hypothetical protein [Candidatus Aminicenantes bacterium]
MQTKGKKFIALFLVFSLMMLSVNLYAKERRGAKLVITKKDGQQIKGELITVKPNSLLLLDTEGKDVSIDVADIKVIKIVKKSKVLQGIGLGLLIGAGTGALLGFMGGDDPSPSAFFHKAEEKALVGGIFVGAIGLLVGGTLGFALGIDDTIQIEGMPPETIEGYLNKLRKKARIRDYK